MADSPAAAGPDDADAPNSFASAAEEHTNDEISNLNQVETPRNESDAAPVVKRTLFVESTEKSKPNEGNDDEDGDDVPGFLRRAANLRVEVDMEVVLAEEKEQGDGDSVQSTAEANDFGEAAAESQQDRLKVLAKIEDTAEDDIGDGNLVINLDVCRRLISTMVMTFRHEEIKLCRLHSHATSTFLGS